MPGRQANRSRSPRSNRKKASAKNVPAPKLKAKVQAPSKCVTVVAALRDRKEALGPNLAYFRQGRPRPGSGRSAARYSTVKSSLPRFPSQFRSKWVRNPKEDTFTSRDKQTLPHRVNMPNRRRRNPASSASITTLTVKMLYSTLIILVLLSHSVARTAKNHVRGPRVPPCNSCSLEKVVKWPEATAPGPSRRRPSNPFSGWEGGTDHDSETSRCIRPLSRPARPGSGGHPGRRCLRTPGDLGPRLLGRDR